MIYNDHMSMDDATHELFKVFDTGNFNQMLRLITILNHKYI